MTYFLTTMGAGTGPGNVVQCTVPTAKLNGKPIVTVGSVATHPYGTDVVIEGLPGILLNGQPVAFSTAKTAMGGCLIPNTSVKISFAQAQVPSYVGFVAAPRVEKLTDIVVQVFKNAKKAAKALANEALPEESSDVKLTSDYALQQLTIAARNHTYGLFANRMMLVFDQDIAPAAIKQLYDNLLDGSLQAPEIKVCRNPVHGTIACYHSKTQTIYVYENEVRAAATDNKVRHRLMAALVEEFGHHVDNLLRCVYDKNAKDDAKGDEGARYAYQGIYREYAVDPLESTETAFATAEIDGTTIELAYEYAELHNALNKYTKHRQTGTDDHIADGYEGFALGDLSKIKSAEFPNGGFGHENIQREVVQQVVDFENIDRYTDYLYKGNWMRDYSQLIAPKLVEMMSNQDNIKAAEDKAFEVLKAFNNKIKTDKTATKYADSQWLNNVKQKTKAAVKAGSQGIQNIQENYFKPADCVSYLSDMVGILAMKKYADNGKYYISRKRYKDWRKIVDGVIPGFYEELGVSVPWDHFDNPYGLEDSSGTYKKFCSGVSADKNTYATKIDDNLGMKNHIRISPENKSKLGDIKTAHNHLRSKLTAVAYVMQNPKSSNTTYDQYLYFIKPSFKHNIENKQLVKLGGALHILQDYYAHSNYPEIYMAKCAFDRVITFTDCDRLMDNCNKGYAMNSQTAEMAFSENARKELLWKDRFYERGGLVLNKQHLPEYNRRALYAPVTSGTYDDVDLVHTALAMMHELMLKEEIFDLSATHDYKVKEGELTVNDVLILESLALFDKAVGGGSIYIGLYNRFLDMRDYYVSEKALIGSWSWRGVFDWVKDKFNIEIEFFERVKNTISLVRNYIMFSFLRLIATTLVELLPNLNVGLNEMMVCKYPIVEKGIGNNPSHTFLAKDKADHPVNNIAGKMAIEASARILGIIVKAKAGMNSKNIEQEIDGLISHPCTTTLFDYDVEQWASKNHESLLRSSLYCYSLDIFTQTLKWCDNIKDTLERATQKSGKNAFVGQDRIFNFLDEYLVGQQKRDTIGESIKELRKAVSTAAQIYKSKGGYNKDLQTVKDFYEKVICKSCVVRLSKDEITRRWEALMQPYLKKLIDNKVDTYLPKITAIYK